MGKLTDKAVQALLLSAELTTIEFFPIFMLNVLSS